MNVLVMGCGRVGSSVAERLDREGHDVTVIDTDADAFLRLPPSFGGERLLGSALDERVLRSAGIAEADAFLALTQGDNRNLFAAQIAQQLFGVKSVVTRVYDPLRAELFARLGLRTFSPTRSSVELACEALQSGTSSDDEASGEPEAR